MDVEIKIDKDRMVHKNYMEEMNKEGSIKKNNLVSKVGKLMAVAGLLSSVKGAG